MGHDWAAIGLAVEIAAGGAGVAWWVVRSFWKIDVRLGNIETVLGLGWRQNEQRRQSAARIFREGKRGANLAKNGDHR